MLRSIITEDDADQVYDPLRIAFLVTVVVAIGLQVYTVVWQDNAFNIQDFGIGMGSLLGATGAGLWASSYQK